MRLIIKNTLCAIGPLTVVVVALSAQDYIGVQQEFLNGHEIDLIREAQDPNLRIHHYLKFAKMRIELIRLQLEEHGPGRSKTIHRTLKEYGHIMETIDLVIDNALDSDLDITPTIKHLAKQQEALLTALEKITNNKANDHFRYEFVLEDAIEITQDSIESIKGDLEIRKAQLQEAATREIAKREASMIPALKREIDEIRKETEKKKSQRPSLLRPGEKLNKR